MQNSVGWTMALAMMLGGFGMALGQPTAANPSGGSDARTDGRPVVRIVYFVPTDRKPEPDYQARIDRMMTHVQAFYRNGMNQNGYGQRTFELDRDAKGALRIHSVQAKGPMRNYGRNDASKVRAEVKDALAKQGVNIDQETIVIFQLLLEWNGKKATEIGPFVGGGGPRSGTAWVYDDVRLDPRFLSSKQPGGYYQGYCTLGKFNTEYIGGLAHELGHALGLPHDRQQDRDGARFGASLMGSGNHAYGENLRGEGKGAFLSPASALPLSRHPLFTGKPMPAKPITGRITDLVAIWDGLQYVLSGKIEGGAPSVGLVAFNDPILPKGDYDAVGWIGTVNADGTFRVAVGELKPNDYELRLEFFSESGDSKAFAFRYSIAKSGKPDLRPFEDTIAFQRANAAFLARDAKQLSEMVTGLKQKYPANDPVIQKAEHLQRLLKPSAPVPLDRIPNTAKQTAVADLQFESARVGYGNAARNQVIRAGDSPITLEVGGKFFDSGLFAHAPAQHQLRLNGTWTRFTTQYGLQDGHDGSVVFVIKGDGRELFRSMAVRDHVVREISVDLSNVKRLELIVEDAGDGAGSDWGVWLNPQLQR
ncbi:NPCBM/NEW2 domain-containing protein [Tuwongella immobilis]|nr:NPCBM/NEW2 domain-containing protein [Tuwongella immobilis]